ncbi:zf-C2HC5-domain-containing protein [Astrocystis sublimbata]|nr:zf-C2HC5-domain-containing protein [Astrocystis sublimbata]
MSATQLFKLLPLPEEELQQVIDYAATLSKPEAAEHFSNLLGDSPDAVEFIASFNARRAATTSTSNHPSPQPSTSQTQSRGSAAEGYDGVPRSNRNRGKKKKADLHTPAPRKVLDAGVPAGTAYNKKSQVDDYVSSSKRPSPSPARAQPPAVAGPSFAKATAPSPSPSSSSQNLSVPGRQEPNVEASRSARTTPGSSRSSTPGPRPKPQTQTKVNVSGGTAMHGASTVLSDLDDAIRSLEMTTNPSQIVDANLRRCNCVAARHPLLVAAPNCLSCGKVICVKEGLGPCTFCGAPLLSSADVQLMIRELRDERGKEKMARDRQSHKKAEVSKTPAPFSKPRETQAATSEAGIKAMEHRDRLLNFQAQNAQRTTVRDEAADFDVGTGGNMWSTPEERAKELRRQQKVMREMEWNARPEYEKRRQVVSIDLVGGKVVRKMAPVERPRSPDSDRDEPRIQKAASQESGRNRAAGGGGAFSKNPLLGALIKPVFEAKGEEEGKGKGKGNDEDAKAGRRDAKAKKWRRVQDDLDDNEGLILDGGAYGHGENEAPPRL